MTPTVIMLSSQAGARMALPGTATRAARSGAILWLLCFQFFVAEQIARLDVRGPYSMTHNSISDLGALHLFGFRAEEATSYSPLHALMNTSFLLQGVLIFFGAHWLRSLFSHTVLVRAAFLLFQLSALGVFVVGLAPEDRGADVHVLAASLHFLCGSLAMLLLGLALLRKSNQLAGTVTTGAGMFALAATLLLAFGETNLWGSLEWPMGLVERLAAYPLPLWLTGCGLVLLLRDQLLIRSPSNKSERVKTL